MTKIKLCGLSRECDIEMANELKVDYTGFIFVPGSRRYISRERAFVMREFLSPEIQSVGVFVNETVEQVAELLSAGVISIAQLHGDENEDYIKKLRTLTDKQIIKAFRINSSEDIDRARNCSADFILLDSAYGGSGTSFDWRLAYGLERRYFLAGGLSADNVEKALSVLEPYAVDVSSGIETDGVKDAGKMRKFVYEVRRKDKRR